MGLFYLLTLYAVLRGATSPRPWRWYALAVLCCALGMGCKEVMLSAPLVVLLYDRVFLCGSLRAVLCRRWGLYGDEAPRIYQQMITNPNRNLSGTGFGRNLIPGGFGGFGGFGGGGPFGP
jgi:hypothetical protein